MAVSELEQRYTPLTESHAGVWQPWGPAGPYDIDEESDNMSETSEATVPTRRQRRLQTWGGYTSHTHRAQYEFDATADDLSAEKRSNDVAYEETDTSVHGGGLQGGESEPADSYGGSASSCTASPHKLPPLPRISISSVSTQEARPSEEPVQADEAPAAASPRVLWPSTPRDFLPMRIAAGSVQDITMDTDEWVAQAWSRLDGSFSGGFEDRRRSEFEGAELSIFETQQDMDVPIFNGLDPTVHTSISQDCETQGNMASTPGCVCLSTEPTATPNKGCQYSSEAVDRCHFISECTHTTYPSESGYGAIFSSEVTDTVYFSEGFTNSSKESAQDSRAEAASASREPCYASEQSAAGAGARRDRHSRRSKKSKTSTDAAKGAQAQSPVTEITTLMVQNLPWSLSREELLAELDKGFAGLYNFCHVPRIFKTGKNQGFAFVNFISQAVAEQFAWAWHGSVTRFGMTRACKGLRVKVATIQGIEACKKISASKKMQRVKTSTFKPLVLPQPMVLEVAA